MTARIALALAAQIALVSCSLGPHYVAPALPDGKAWTQLDAPAGSPPDRWWRQLEDGGLTALIERALGDNLNLALAGERIEEARALRDRAAGGRRPAMSAEASAARRRQSETGLPPAGRIPGFPTYQSLYDIGLDASWEVDLFGRIDHQVAAAQARLEASEEVRRDAAVSLAAEVARSYFEYRGCEAELAARSAALASAERAVDLARRGHEAGASSLLAVRQADARLARAQASIPGLRARKIQLGQALVILAGGDRRAVQEVLEQSTPLPRLEPVPVGTPAELLRRRPDVRRAERALAAASADIAVARGALYPRLHLAGGGGFTSLGSGDLLDAASRTWSVAPLMSWRVLDGGRVEAEIRVAESRQRQAALAYEKTILEALAESEQALAGYREGLATVAALAEATAAAQALHRLTARQQAAGQVSEVVVLEAALAEHEARAALARGQVATATALARLYKALGGGWEALAAGAR